MPFPIVDGRSFQDNKAALFAALEDQMGHPFTPLVKQLYMDLLSQAEVVVDQLYTDVQTLKRLAHDRGWEIEADDPSQQAS